MNRRRRFTATRPEPSPAPGHDGPPSRPDSCARWCQRTCAHPMMDFSPAELANVLGRREARGAITNACRRLVEQGLATRTQHQPQRYRAVI